MSVAHNPAAADSRLTFPDVVPVAIRVPVGPSGYLALAAGRLPLHNGDTSHPIRENDKGPSVEEATDLTTVCGATPGSR